MYSTKACGHYEKIDQPYKMTVQKGFIKAHNLAALRQVKFKA